MKHLIITILMAALSLASAAAQEPDSTAVTTPAEKLDFDTPVPVVTDYLESVKLHLSKDWRKSWRPEISARINAMFFHGSYDFTAGIRTSPNKVFGFGGGPARDWIDAIPARVFRANLYLFHRHYLPLDKKRRISLYSDIFGGGNYVYKIQCSEQSLDEAHEWAKEGQVDWYFSWQPGISIRMWGKSNFFLGVSIGPSIGVHTGIAL